MAIHLLDRDITSVLDDFNRDPAAVVESWLKLYAEDYERAEDILLVAARTWKAQEYRPDIETVVAKMVYTPIQLIARQCALDPPEGISEGSLLIGCRNFQSAQKTFEVFFEKVFDCFVGQNSFRWLFLSFNKTPSVSAIVKEILENSQVRNLHFAERFFPIVDSVAVVLDQVSQMDELNNYPKIKKLIPLALEILTKEYPKQRLWGSVASLVNECMA